MKKYILPVFTVLGVALGLIIGISISQKANAQRIVFQEGTWKIEQSKIDRLLQLMEEMYVDDLNIDSITDEAMAEFVQKLDPHSSYIPKEDLEMVNSVYYSAGHGAHSGRDSRRAERRGRCLSRRQTDYSGRQLLCR